ncbi:ubiquitin-related modifier 1 isoform X2 [Epinephelus moara]|uniref:ubiquitin-related modifier 1 isoform X2 n=1 Tax=Epinephelus moara TaxID=300413 RepID=UPI00214EC2CA|nr:ubiquitin-related modifier 1 isoform X2 [Epinephelus moara]
MAAPIAIHLEFGGGAELLFNGVKEHHVTLPSQSEPWDVKQLLVWIQRNLLKERPELFVQGDSVGSWTINYKTKTTLCLFPLFMEDRKRVRNTTLSLTSL